jgi:hypothetical protein
MPILQRFTGIIQVQLLSCPGKGVPGGHRADVPQDHQAGRSLLQHAEKTGHWERCLWPREESLKEYVEHTLNKKPVYPRTFWQVLMSLPGKGITTYKRSKNCLRSIYSEGKMDSVVSECALA